jgi:hypothetical protein
MARTGKIYMKFWQTFGVHDGEEFHDELIEWQGLSTGLPFGS